MTISDKMKKDTRIAIVGMACRFPDAKNYEQYWKNIKNGVDSVKDINEKRWKTTKFNQGVFPSSDSETCCYDGMLAQIEYFDYSFFNISPREAKYMDPQHRILLEETVHCIEDSGIPICQLQKEMTSVYVGLTGNDYNLFTLVNGENTDNYASLGSFNCMAANRISHYLGLQGVSLTLDTACSSSLVSIHLAKQSLLTKESDFAIAGGVCLAYHPWRYVSFSKSHMMSPDGMCKTFDEDANGFVQGEGVGVLLLQRLEDAIRDHNHIYGVIKGSAVNHCGESLTIAAPKVEAQKNVILKAMHEAQTSFENISYVETHGTGTSLGDPIEVEALTKAFRTDTQKEQFCDLGSVKTNIGHLGSAAGVAGVIKVLLMMKYQQIPKLLHLKKKNAIINFSHSPFTISVENKAWEPETGVRCAGVSGFGFGGVNAHVILEEWQPEVSEVADKQPTSSIFMLSAKSQESLEELIQSWQESLPEIKEDINSICATLATGRNMYEYRTGVVVNNKEELSKFLNQNVSIHCGKKNVEYILYFGEKKIASQAEVESLPAFEEVNQVLNELQLRRSELSGEMEQLIYQYAIGSFLLKALDKKPSYLKFRGNGIWASLVLSNMITLKQAMQLLLGKQETSFVLNRPQIPIFDWTQECIQGTFEFDADYIQWLLEQCRISEEEARYYIEKGRVLFQKQRTFIKFFQDWCVAAGERQIDLTALLYEETLEEKMRVLLITAIICSIQKLNDKWELEKDQKIASEAYREILDLCSDQVMSAKCFVEALFPTENGYGNVVEELRASQVHLNTKNQYSILRERNRMFKEGADALDWIQNNQSIQKQVETQLVTIGCGCEEQEAEYTCFMLNTIKEDLLKLWLSGRNIDFRVIWKENSFEKVPLPTYAFQREECWMESMQTTGIHPMIDCNESTLQSFVLRKSISLADFYVRDHIVNDRVIVPGVFYLEMARAAGVAATGQEVVELTNIMWLQTCVLDAKKKDVYVSVLSKQQYYEFEIYSIKDKKKVVHAQGRIRTKSQSAIKPGEHYDVSEIMGRCDYSIDHTTCYENVFRDYIGFDYGPGFQVTDQAYGNEKEGFEHLILPEFLEDSASEYVLHPSILDAALRAITWVGGRDAYQHKVLHIPFALGKIEILGEIPNKTYSYARLSSSSVGKDAGSQRYDISILDEQGNEVVRVYDFTIRSLKESEENKRKDVVKYYKKTYQKSEEAIRTEEGTSIFVQVGENFKKQEENHYVIPSCNSTLAQQLCETLKAESLEIDQLIYQCGGKEGKQGCAFEQYEANKEELVTLLYLVQAIKKTGLTVKQIIVITQAKEELGIRLEMMTGFFKSIKSILTKVKLRTVALEPKDMGRLLQQELNFENEGSIDEIVYEHGERYISRFTPLLWNNSKPSRLVKEGVYLITGAQGGVGRQIALYLAKTYQARLILTGRSTKTEQTKHLLEELKSLGGQAEYVSCDLTNASKVEELAQTVQVHYGNVNGIIQCAGVTDQRFVMEATEADYEKVLGVKVLGTLNLDVAFEESTLDFFVMTSSISSVIGDYQRGSYAAANGFLDSFARYRNCLVENHKRNGMTYAIDWPIWADGTMKPVGKEKEAYYEYSGMEDISSKDAMFALEEILKGNVEQVVLITGDHKRVEASLNERYTKRKVEVLEQKVIQTATTTINQSVAFDSVAQYLRELIATTIGLNVDKMKFEESFDHYGIDSIMIAELNKELNSKFTDVPATLFFEYNNIEGLTTYFLEHHKEEIDALFEEDEVTTEAAETIQDPQDGETFMEPVQVFKEPEVLEEENQDIAIIGIDGRYPQADTLDEFWNHIASGDDCITEIPKDRWDHSHYFDKEKGKKNKVYCKWGGFLNSVDEFDPLFFNISPKEAMVIDPQERLFLECVYHTIENSGYTKASLGTSAVGVFVGVMNGQYQLYGAEELKKGHVIDVRSTYASIANRVSYYFDFHGPSMAVDTMCSSSLTSIHLACQSIRNGECEMAIAGGVNVIVHPSKYVFLSEQKFGSTEGKCRAFGNGGDGYVPAEGVGAFLLKPLKQAIKDHDHIYGVIKGSGMNHGGRTNGYTVPNPNAQAALIENVLRKSSTNPESITYLEAHGTGTQLGDPIEIAGLSKAYHKFTNQTGFCTIGSVKDCIGHAESAAGVASITKILLQMQHKKIAPSIYGGETNEHIDFSKTPFRITTELMDWEKPATGEKRTAGVSSFGAGGSNVHIILEEYDNEVQEQTRHPKDIWLFPLSAQTETALLAYVKEYRVFLEQLQQQYVRQYGISEKKTIELQKEIIGLFADYLCVVPQQFALDESLYAYNMTAYDIDYLFGLIQQKYGVALSPSDIVEYDTIGKLVAYVQSGRGECKEVIAVDENYGIHLETFVQNLFLGREAMEHRLGILFTSIRDLQSKLKKYEESKVEDGVSIFVSKKSAPKTVNLELKEIQANYFADYKMEEIARCWVEGEFDEWNMLYSQDAYIKMNNLPTYPFKKEHLWLEQWPEQGSEQPTKKTLNVLESIHLSSKDTILKDHIVSGQPLLAGVAQIKYVMEELRKHVTGERIVLKEVYWLKPLVVSNQKEILISLSGEEEAHFEVKDVEGNIYSRGRIRLEHGSGVENGTCKKLREHRGMRSYSKEEVYQEFEQQNIFYGPSFQGIEEMQVSEAYVHTRIKGNQNEWIDLAVLDGILQSLSGFTREMDTTFVPYMIGSASMQLPIKGSIDVDLMKKDGNLYDLQVYTERGELCGEFQDVCIKELSKEKHNIEYYYPVWKVAEYEKTSLTEQAQSYVIAYGKESKLVADKLATFVAGIGGNCQKVKMEENWYEVSSLKEFNAIYYLDWAESENQVTRDRIVPFYRFCKSLIDAGYDTKRLTIKVITNCTYEILGEEVLHPFGAALIGFANTIQQEIPLWNICCVDVEKEALEKEEYLIPLLYAEQANKVAIRNGKRYECVWRKDETRNAVRKNFTVGGTYIILGGAGGIGFTLCEYLAKTYQANVILVGRKEQDQLQGKVQMCLEQRKGQVQYYSADICDVTSLSAIVQEVRNHFGVIHGVIHSAASLRDCAVWNMKETDLIEVMQPKAEGVSAIKEVFANVPLDFVCLFSSMQSMKENPGQANYAAANEYLDAYASYLQQTLKTKVVVINWGYWDAIGIAGDLQHKELLEKRGIHPIHSQEGMRALEHVFASKKSQMSAIKVDHSKFHIASIENNQVKNKEANIAPPKTRSTDSKKRVVDVIREAIHETLAIREDEIDNTRQFSEYGVDSILGVSMVSEINQKLNLQLKTTVLFDYVNVENLATYIAGLIKEDVPPVVETSDSSEIEILKRLAKGELTTEDVMKLYI